MDATELASAAFSTHLLRFRSLFDDGRGYAFPCDARGHVEMDGLGKAALSNYLFARTVVGREFSLPAVEPAPR